MSDRWDEVYAEKYREHGPTYRALLWGDAGRQRRTYVRVLHDFDPLGKTVVDLGCGFADFLRFLRGAGLVPKRYIGVDRRPEFLDEARRRFPENGGRLDVRFLRGDAEAMPLPVGDVVVAIGVLATVTDPWPLLARMWEAASETVIVTALSDRNYQGKLVPHDPVKLLAEALLLSHNVVLRHDAGDQEFILTLRRPGPTPPLRQSRTKAPTPTQRAPERS